MNINKLIKNHNSFILETSLNTITVTRTGSGFKAKIKWKIGNESIEEINVTEKNIFDWVTRNHSKIQFA